MKDGLKSQSCADEGPTASLAPVAEPSATHTPGPWITRAARDGSGDIGIKADGPINIHAEVFAEFWERGAFRREEAEANARLIAAAPDMLEALRQLHDEGGNAILGMALAGAAIAKATGNMASPMQPEGRAADEAELGPGRDS